MEEQIPTIARGTIPANVVWLTKISETTSSLTVSSLGYSTCQVICWAPVRLLLLSISKSICKISWKDTLALENKIGIQVQLKTKQQNARNKINGNVAPTPATEALLSDSTCRPKEVDKSLNQTTCQAMAIFYRWAYNLSFSVLKRKHVSH